VDEARIEAVVRDDGDGIVEAGEQLLTGSVSRRSIGGPGGGAADGAVAEL
jgi:hypothetical protein